MAGRGENSIPEDMPSEKRIARNLGQTDRRAKCCLLRAFLSHEELFKWYALALPRKENGSRAVAYGLPAMAHAFIGFGNTDRGNLESTSGLR